MKTVKFSEVPINSKFIFTNWLHTKLNETTYLSTGYAASNGMDCDLTVTLIEEDDLNANPS
jgi:hypothetical protein